MIGRKAGLRSLFALSLVLATALLVAGYGFASGTDPGRLAVGSTVAGSADGWTVITTDSNAWLGQGRDGPRAKAEIVAIGPDGRVRYYDDSHTRYWDVDPVEGTDRTVEYVAADHLPPEACGGDSACTRNVVERVNLSTGESTVVFSRITPGKHSTRWHDVDRLDDEHIVIADIARDRVFVVNTTSGLTTWAWSAQSAFPTAGSGGPYPDDWTHLNDVEVLEDGRIMVSLRNHDRVVFLDRETGLLEGWTLGAEDAHDVLYEQHNPDFIPESAGGPAVVVADSENHRVVEYQRRDGGWERSWTWTDDRLQWPRDADRLPDGNTLITDSNGNRVIEIDETGEIVWQVEIAFPYEAERLGTGDESEGGPSAAQAGLANGGRDGTAAGGASGTDGGERATGPAGLAGSVAGAIDAAGHSKPVNAVIYVLPVWFGRIELGALVALVLTLVAWGGTEAYWSGWRVSVHRPLSVRRPLSVDRRD